VHIANIDFDKWQQKNDAYEGKQSIGNFISVCYVADVLVEFNVKTKALSKF
jgi:hypothetical protein